jgi:hypothetical protein
MIIYDLSCRQGHRFEGWFPKPADFEAQKEKGLLSCQVCGDTCVEKVLTGGRYVHSTSAHPAPSVSERPQTDTLVTSEALDAATIFKAVRHYVTTHFENVGDRFAEILRAMQKGEVPDRPIYGRATPEEREKLEEDDIPFAMLPDLGHEFNQ